MIKPAILKALNAQIQHELANAHAYQAISLYFGRLNLHGFELFMARQAMEERMHAERFIRHLAARGGEAELGAVPVPQATFASVLEAVRTVRDWERATTARIHHLFELTRKDDDYALEVLLHWFIAEQVEEEQWSDELSALTEKFHEHPAQMFMLDHQWGKRKKETFTNQSINY